MLRIKSTRETMREQIKRNIRRQASHTKTHLERINRQGGLRSPSMETQLMGFLILVMILFISQWNVKFMVEEIREGLMIH